jgi:hypothetical protein
MKVDLFLLLERNATSVGLDCFEVLQSPRQTRRKRKANESSFGKRKRGRKIGPNFVSKLEGKLTKEIVEA